MRKKICFFIFLLQPIVLKADIIYLKNGQFYRGTIIRQTLTKVEIQLQNKQFISINKEEIKKIVYISDIELRKIQKQQQEEQKKRLEAIKKEQEELQRKLEEEKRLQELQQKIEEQKRLEEIQKQQEELERQKLEEEKRLQELLIKELEESEQIIELPKKEPKKYQFQYQIGIGLGSFNIPLNQFYQYYNIFSAYEQNSNSLYKQNLKIQMRTLPTWNWAGNLHAGVSSFYKDFEAGFLIISNIQKPNPKFISIPNKNIFGLTSDPQYESYSENRYNQNKYFNLASTIFFKFGTSEYLDFFWNYIFPYVEIGYFNRNLEFESNSSSTLITSIRNTFTDEFEFFNGYITNNTIKNHLIQNALSFGIPFRFLMIFSSEFLLEFHTFWLGKSQLLQRTFEYNIDNLNLSNTIFFKSEFNGNFKGNKISFLWQNKYSSNSIAYMRINKTEYETTFKELNGYSLLLLPQSNFNLINPIVLFSNPNSKTIKENSSFIEFGIKHLNTF